MRRALSDGILQDVGGQVRMPCAVVLARLYGETVMCVADTRGTGSVSASGLTDVIEHRLVLLATTEANLLAEQLRLSEKAPPLREAATH